VHKIAEGDPVTRIALGEAHLSVVGAARPAGVRFHRPRDRTVW
jgi:hypothetical protein